MICGIPRFGKICALSTPGGWNELVVRIGRLGRSGAFVLLPTDSLAALRSARLTGLQLVGHSIVGAGGEERCLFVALNSNARNADGSPMDAADLLVFAIGLNIGVPLIYGDCSGLFACHGGHSLQLSDCLDLAALGDAWGRARRCAFGPDQDGGFVFDALIAPCSHAGALAMLASGVWD